MFIEKSEKIEIVVNSSAQATSLGKKTNQTIMVGDKVKIHWTHLRKSKLRTLSIELKCDGCGEHITRRIRDLKPEVTTHFCLTCGKTGDKNPRYGIPCSEEAKNGYQEWVKENGNPFTWDATIEKIKAANPWVKIAARNTGQRRTKEQKQVMSKAALKAFKKGTRVPCKRWGTTIIKQYKGIDYQSSYELRFLKHVEGLGLLEQVTRGPEIPYTDYDGKERTYFSDYQINSIIFEVKSTYIWNKGLKTNLLKKEAAEKLYNYNIILDNNFKRINTILCQ